MMDKKESGHEDSPKGQETREFLVDLIVVSVSGLHDVVLVLRR